MKRKWVLALGLAAFLGVGCVCCRGGHEAGVMKEGAPGAAAAAPAAGEAVNIECPVTGSKVQVTPETPRSMYNGKTYYFCCAGCKESFDKNPQAYTK